MIAVCTRFPWTPPVLTLKLIKTRSGRRRERLLRLSCLDPSRVAKSVAGLQGQLCNEVEVKGRRRGRNATPEPLSERISPDRTITVDVGDHFIRASHFRDKVDLQSAKRN